MDSASNSTTTWLDYSTTRGDNHSTHGAGNSTVTAAPMMPSFDLAGRICVPLFLVLGLLGNTMTIIVMSSKCFRSMAVSKLLIALSISDTTFISLFPFNKFFVRDLLGVDIRTLSDASCKIFFWAFRTAKMTSSWFVVLICIERFIAIWFSIKSKEINTKKKAYISIATVVIVIGSYNGYWCSFADQILPNGMCVPNTKPPGYELQAHVFLIVGLTIYSFLPGLILCIFNGFIIFRIVALRHQTVVTESDRQRRDAIKTTIMLIGISVAFIILVLPISVAHLYFFAVKANIFEAKSPSFVAFRETAQILEQLNYSINFFLYVLCGARFRSRVLIILGCESEPNRPTPPSSQVTNTSYLMDIIFGRLRRRSSTASVNKIKGSTLSLNVNQIRKTTSSGSLAGLVDRYTRREQIQGMHRAASSQCFNALIHDARK